MPTTIDNVVKRCVYFTTAARSEASAQEADIVSIEANDFGGSVTIDTENGLIHGIQAYDVTGISQDKIPEANGPHVLYRVQQPERVFNNEGDPIGGDGTKADDGAGKQAAESTSGDLGSKL